MKRTLVILRPCRCGVKAPLAFCPRGTGTRKPKWRPANTRLKSTRGKDLYVIWRIFRGMTNRRNRRDISSLRLDVSVLSLLFCGLVVGIQERRCAYNQFTIESGSGNFSCLNCIHCPRGFGLSPPCDTTLSYLNIKIECKPCQLGKTYSKQEGIGSCESCGSCSNHQIVEKNCTLYSDSQCKDTCSKGFYYQEATGDCQPCTWCCPVGSIKVKKGCKEMPPYKQCDVNTAKNCKPKCQNDQYIVPGSKGGGHCKDCESCPPGTAPFPECGSVVENTEQVKCKECIEGKTFSDNYGKSQCKPCTSCSLGQKEVLPCNLTNDRVCSDCDKGFYRDVNITHECKPCSACCNDDKDVHVEKCVEQKMPKGFQCSQVNRVGSVCKVKSNNKPKFKSLAAVFIATTLTAGIILLLVSIWYWRFKFHRHKTITSHQSLALLLPSEEASSETRFEYPTVSGMQETLCFEKSGVVLQFNDPESFLNDGQRVRSKICWDKALTVSLPSHEIQLSPAIQFYPHGSKLSKPVHATVPHSALMDSGHGWSIGLKSFTLGSGSKVVWKDEIVDKIHDNEVSFYMDCLLAYVVVGTPVYKCSKATKKRFQSAVFGGEGKVGQDYTVYLYLFDDCEASLEKLMQDERYKNNILLGSPQSIYVESAYETDVKIEIKQLCGGWKLAPTNPEVIPHKSIKESYRTFPCAEILFEHDDARNRDFRCNIELTADDTTIQICAVASIKEDPFLKYKESRTGQQHQMVTGRGQCGDFEATAEVQRRQPENLMASGNSGDPRSIQTCGRSSILEGPSGNNDGSDTHEQNQVVTGQGGRASKPLESLVHDLSKSVEKIFLRLDTRTKGASHYDCEVIGNYFGHDRFEVKSRFEKSDGGPSRAMIEEIVVRHPELTVEKFARVVEEKARRKDVADLLRAYDRDSLSRSGDLSLGLE
ncbi:PREDICTED: uncharacterized protein LOC107354960 isoform X3 [Acropora digitifera]|uniref:uncharacterized protein LOC107354960 isoform X3 n=1 Tax=Acropora digitifera TaxID=70779 RepID=UPI00077B15A5|nr:PREDICTED: uncharacterized protein LOC107354960 isoform X3 [Acropora digitifera]